MTAYGINDSGQVVGGGFFSGSDFDAFLYDGSGMHDLGLPGNFTGAFVLGALTARAINSQGDIVGTTTSGGYLYSHGAIQDLGAMGMRSAWGINDLRQVVGWSPSTTALIYEAGAVYDLNSLIDPSSGWTLEQATGINDLGQIVAVGYRDGEGHAVLMTPVPEPNAVGLAGTALAMLSLIVWQRQRTALSAKYVGGTPLVLIGSSQLLRTPAVSFIATCCQRLLPTLLSSVPLLSASSG